MKTKLHHYCFNVSDPAQKAAYEAMKKLIKADCPQARGQWMNAWGSEKGESRTDTQEVEIETSCLFENQWNEADSTGNRRLFDWYEEYPVRIAKTCKRGHWLEITPEMALARINTRKCGYCGKHYGPFHDPIPEDGFCRACLDSPYLKESDLYMTRLRSLVTSDLPFQPLTEAEKAALLPLYVSRQTTGADSRAKSARDKQRADVLKKFTEETTAATIERDGMLWLWDHGFSLDNVIYYSHSDKFGFGWLSPVSKAVCEKLLEVMSEFPFHYEIKAENGTFANSPTEQAA